MGFVFFLCYVLFVRFCTVLEIFMQLSDVDRQIILSSLLLRQAQLRRAINGETDSAVVALRQAQLRQVDELIFSFRSGDSTL